MGRWTNSKMIEVRGWEEGLDIVISISNKSLDAGGSISKVGVLPRHSSDKPHERVARNYYAIVCYKWWYLFLYLEIFHLKSVIMLVLLLDFGKIIFINCFFKFFKMNDTVNFEENVFVNVYILSNHNIPFKFCDAEFNIPSFEKKSTLFKW